jgi:SH3-like domain-containing protein
VFSFQTFSNRVTTMNRLLHTLGAILLLTIAPAVASADPIRIGGEHCVIGVRADDPLNLRTGPGTGHRVLSRLPHARCGVFVTRACAGAWCPVEDGHHAGWVNRRHIAAASAPTNCVSPLTNGRHLPLRAWPSDESRILTLLVSDNCGIALLPYTVDGWHKVRQGGWEGWVRIGDLLFVDG